MISKHVNQWISRGILLFLLLSVVMAASAADYEVDGEIVQTLFKPDGGVQLVSRSRFTVFVKNCSWLIQTTDHDESGKASLVHETACTNGAEVYEVEGPPNDNPGVRGGGRSQNVATIVSNNVPVGQMDDYFVCHLWEMFASGCYFEKLSTNWITPVYDLNASAPVNPKLKREAKWELVNGAGSLPSSVVYLEPVRIRNSPRQTNATYTATGVTNAGEMKIPSGFVFEQRVGSGFVPGLGLPGASGPAYRIRKQAIATVTAVREGCSRSELVPAADGRTIVIDQRLPQVAVPTGDATFSEGEVQSLSGMALRLGRHSDKLSAFLWQTMSNQAQFTLTNRGTSAANAMEMQDVVLGVLNAAVLGPCVYESNRFNGISLRSETTNLMKQTPIGPKLAHLNRLLLEDAFPIELSPRTHPSAYVVRDGVQWLPVEKAKQVYIKEPSAQPKPSTKARVVFYASMVSISAVFLYFMSRLKSRRI